MKHNAQNEPDPICLRNPVPNGPKAITCWDSGVLIINIILMLELEY